MILEVAVLNVIPGQRAEFEAAFSEAKDIIPPMPGHVSHDLKRCVEDTNQYILLVNWQTLQDHTQGFRESAPCQEWRRSMHHFYDPFPAVLHCEPL